MVGRKVVGRAHDLAVPGVFLGTGVHRSRQAQIGELGVALGRHEHVARLDVAVDDARLMGVLQPFRDLRDDVRRRLHAQWPAAANELPQVGAGHEFGDQVVHVAVVARIHRTDQLGVIETAEGLNLAGEIGDGLGRGTVAGQHLDGHQAVQDRVFRLEYVPHAALAQRIDDAVAGRD